MTNIKRRIENIEDKLNLNERSKTVTIVQFGGELPPERTVGNMTIHYVRYDERATKSNQKQPKSEKLSLQNE